MTRDRPDCTNGFSCSDWATFSRITLTFFSKNNTSGNPHPNTIIPFPALPCAPPLHWHDCPCHYVLKWFRKSIQLKLAATGLFFGLSALSILTSGSVMPAQPRRHASNSGQHQIQQATSGFCHCFISIASSTAVAQTFVRLHNDPCQTDFLTKKKKKQNQTHPSRFIFQQD